MHVRQEINSVAHGYGYVIVPRHAVLRLGKVTVVAAGGLRAVETSLSGLDTRGANFGHDFSPESKSKARLRAAFARALPFFRPVARSMMERPTKRPCSRSIRA